MSGRQQAIDYKFAAKVHQAVLFQYPWKNAKVFLPTYGWFSRTPSHMHTLVSVRRSYRCVINARYSVVYSSLASSLFSSRKLSNGEAVTRRRATSCLPLVYPHVMYHPRPSTFSQSFPPPHGRTINARNKNGETRNREGLEPRLYYTPRAPLLSRRRRIYAPLVVAVLFTTHTVTVLVCLSLRPPHAFSLMLTSSTTETSTKLPSDPSSLLEYMQDMPSESDSDDDFEGYLGPEDGPVAYRATADIAMVER